MQTLTDAKKREWVLTFTAADAFRLQREHGIDVNKLTAGDDGEVEKLLQDSWRVLEILVAMAGPQIENKGMLVSFEENGETKHRPSDDFYEGFVGDVLDDFTVKFLLAVADSLPKLKRRVLQATIARISPLLETASQKIETRIAEKDLETDLTKVINKL